MCSAITEMVFECGPLASIVLPRSLGPLFLPKRPPIHRPFGSRTEQQRKRDYGAQRRARGERNPYNAPWPAIRLAHLQAHPLCLFHMEQRQRVAATEVDHIDGDAWNNSPNNHRSLCKRCHSARTARDQGFAKRL